MNLIQALRRFGQQEKNWSKSIDNQDAQLPLIQKLYSKNGFELKKTCPACPEQYDCFQEGKQVAYYRLRHGEFRVDVPDCGGETIYEAFPNGDGIFDNNERLFYLTKALRILQSKLKP